MCHLCEPRAARVYSEIIGLFQSRYSPKGQITRRSQTKHNRPHLGTRLRRDAIAFRQRCHKIVCHIACSYKQQLSNPRIHYTHPHARINITDRCCTIERLCADHTRMRLCLMLFLNAVVCMSRAHAGYLSTVHRPDNEVVLLHVPEALDADKNSKSIARRIHCTLVFFLCCLYDDSSCLTRCPRNSTAATRRNAEAALFDDENKWRLNVSLYFLQILVERARLMTDAIQLYVAAKRVMHRV